MKIFEEKSLSDFSFWSGGEDTAKVLTSEQMEEIEAILEYEYPDGIDSTNLNDLFWFEDDTIAEWLGFDSFEALEHHNSEEEAEG